MQPDTPAETPAGRILSTQTLVVVLIHSANGTYNTHSFTFLSFYLYLKNIIKLILRNQSFITILTSKHTYTLIY
jgi:hypothetical protein